VLGIDSDTPGFSRIRIEPHLGKMTNVGGEMYHPKGKIVVRYRLVSGRWDMEVRLPAGTSGRLIWKGKVYLLKEGENKVVV